ncbi:patatin-like phospholipase family protein [Algoriphagus pacificus]|uniref:Patatin-like phospholipase family protein n=1 Tax=Algoriphagus pacificus TaxID=2811234 RepID=A0ABS3CIZ8_9BACT|nr:patatin-like phospholipase family protein [Algoriphagus pacificus]MBN7817078.1 patatin-like phospholipase family protein [Algoriphagus pacificus]
MAAFRSFQIILTLGFLLSITFPSAAFQENNSSETRPKIGLVLSGGGAKGMAHIGIIRSMEKAGIRPDYVVGTSMGSVVGGLYALGYSADELEEIILNIDWDLIISNRVEFNTIAFEEKEYYNRYLLEFPVVNGKIAFPSGLIEGQMLSEVLHYYTWPANNYKSFDDFPIPFRCVATDIATGQPIIFDDGYLHDAMRSSIAIPTAFTAFDLDSTAVVDGGVVNNFPVDIAKEMGADIVIGVNVSDEDFLEVDQLGGFGGILMQLAMSQSLAKTKGNIEQCDIYIKPDLGIYSTASFGNYKEILALGDETGQLYFDDFKQLADSLGRNDKVLGIGFKEAPIQISGVSFVGNRLFSTSLLQSKLGISAGETVSREELETAIRRVYGINGFYKVDYSLVPFGEDRYNLKVRLKEKPATLLSTAIHYDNRFSAGILFNLTARDFIGKNSRTVFLLDVSENPKARIDHYKYFAGNKNLAFNARLNLLRQQLPQYENGEESFILVDRNSSLVAQMITTGSLKQFFALGAIYEYSKSRLQFNFNFSDALKNGVQSSLGLRFRYYRNSQNDRNYPTRGAEGLFEPTFHLTNNLTINLKSGFDELVLNLDGIEIPIAKEDLPGFTDALEPDPYFSILGRYSKFLYLSPKFQFKPEVAGGLTLTNTAGRVYQEFFVGGYQNIRFSDTNFWGLNYAEVQSPNFAKLGMSAQFIPLKKIYLRAGANYLGFSDTFALNDEEFFDKLFQTDSFFGFGTDITYQSIIGPITVGVSSNSSDKKLRSYFSLGFSFNYSDR